MQKYFPRALNCSYSGPINLPLRGQAFLASRGFPSSSLGPFNLIGLVRGEGGVGFMDVDRLVKTVGHLNIGSGLLYSLCWSEA